MTSVLIVDDDPVVCDLVTRVLDQPGFDVRQASDGPQALREVAVRLPDLVLLDIIMPGMSGLAVLEQWRSDHVTGKLPVILLTAKAQESDVEQGLELGADDYILKPFGRRELMRRVSAIISRTQSP